MGAGDPLIVGVSTRALTESACRAGEDIRFLDYFGDRDQHEMADGFCLARDFGLPLSGKGLCKAVLSLAPDSLVYTAGLDNHPKLVATLARGAKIYGNSPETLAKSKDWRFLRKVCREKKITCPHTILPGETEKKGPSPWLQKPARGGGGQGVRPWHGGPLARGNVAQAFVKGTAASCALLADGERCLVLGISEQLIGVNDFGVSGFRWCGNLFPFAARPGLLRSLHAQVEEMAGRLTRALGLVGACGLDLVISQGQEGIRAHLIEVNPRPTASMELMEDALGVNIYSLHLAACRGHLPELGIKQPQGVWGKAVIFAGRDLVLPPTDGWREKGRKDIPFGNQAIKAHSPVCTIFAQGKSREQCLDELRGRAANLRQEIADDKREQNIPLDHRPDHQAGPGHAQGQDHRGLPGGHRPRKYEPRRHGRVGFERG